MSHPPVCHSSWIPPWGVGRMAGLGVFTDMKRPKLCTRSIAALELTLLAPFPSHPSSSEPSSFRRPTSLLSQPAVPDTFTGCGAGDPLPGTPEPLLASRVTNSCWRPPSFGPSLASLLEPPCIVVLAGGQILEALDNRLPSPEEELRQFFRSVSLRHWGSESEADAVPGLKSFGCRLECRLANRGIGGQSADRCS